MHVFMKIEEYLVKAYSTSSLPWSKAWRFKETIVNQSINVLRAQPRKSAKVQAMRGMGRAVGRRTGRSRSPTEIPTHCEHRTLEKCQIQWGAGWVRVKRRKTEQGKSHFGSLTLQPTPSIMKRSQEDGEQRDEVRKKCELQGQLMKIYKGKYWKGKQEETRKETKVWWCKWKWELLGTSHKESSQTVWGSPLLLY